LMIFAFMNLFSRNHLLFSSPFVGDIHGQSVLTVYVFLFFTRPKHLDRVKECAKQIIEALKKE
jgi:hypothetical protein